MASTDETSTKRCTGQVKWFNNKAGYGFITMKGDDGEQLDIFAHYSTVHIEQSQYKYLVQGEYVSFIIEKVDGNDKYSHQAKNVKGINSGPLMCETRNENAQHNKLPRGKMINKVNLGNQWMLVQKRPDVKPNNDNNKKRTK